MGDLKDNNNIQKKFGIKRVRNSRSFNLIIRHTVTYHFALVINIKNTPTPPPPPPPTPASSGIYFLKAKNRTARKMCGICSKLTTLKMSERGQ